MGLMTIEIQERPELPAFSEIFHGIQLCPKSWIGAPPFVQVLLWIDDYVQLANQAASVGQSLNLHESHFWRFCENAEVVDGK